MQNGNSYKSMCSTIYIKFKNREWDHKVRLNILYIGVTGEMEERESHCFSKIPKTSSLFQSSWRGRIFTNMIEGVLLVI